MNSNMKPQRDFIIACKKGNIKLAKKLLETNPALNISAENDHAFRWTCSYGHLDVAKWLLEIKPTIDIFVNNHYAFRTSCLHDHIDVATWLVELYPNKYKFTIEGNKILNYEISEQIIIDGTKIISSSEICPICYTTNCDVITNCEHTYCNPCINNWLTNNQSCPTCRANIKNNVLRNLVVM